MQGIGQIQSFYPSFTRQTHANAPAAMPAHIALPASAAVRTKASQMRYTRLSNAPPQAEKFLRDKRGTITGKALSSGIYPPLHPKFNGPLPPEQPSFGLSDKSMQRPQPARQTPLPLLGLQDFFDAQGIRVQVKTARADALKHLHTLLLSGAKKSTPSFSAGELPLSQPLIDLVGQLLKSYGYHEQMATMPKHIDDVFLRRIVGDMLIALIIPEHFASEANFNNFNFLDRFREQVSVAALAKKFSSWVGYYLGRPNAASQWATSLILSSLHPELARTDTPRDMMCGSLEWADLKAAIDMLDAAGIDHGNFSYTELIGFARESAAGVKLNNPAGKELWRIQTPTALWYAHANRQIDLAVRVIDAESTIRTAIDYLDEMRIAALKRPLPKLMAAIKVLQEKPKTREAIARVQLLRLGLRPDANHQMYDESELEQHCRGKQTVLASYLKNCLERVEYAYCLKYRTKIGGDACEGEHIPALDGLVESALEKFDLKRAIAFEDVKAVRVLSGVIASNATIEKPDAYLAAAEQLKQALTPFDYCIAAIADEPAETSKKLCHVDLSNMNADALRGLHSRPEKKHYLEELTRAKVTPEVAGEASERFKAQLSINSAAQRASTFPTVLQDMERAVIAVPDNPNRPYRLPVNSIRLLANPAASNRFFNALAKMLGQNQSTQRIQQQLEIAGTRPAPIALPPIFPSTLFTGHPGEIALRIEIPPNTEMRQIQDPEGEAKGIVTFALNGLNYQIDLYSFTPSLALVSDIRRHSEDLPLCREERALPALASRSQSCEETTAITDEENRHGRMIQHRNRFIQLAPLEGRVQRPRQEMTIFFPENQAQPPNANVVIIDQVLFRGNALDLTRSTLEYRRVSPDSDRPIFPPLRPLPLEMEASLRDRGGAERPMIEYTLTSEDAPENSTVSRTRQIRTRIRRDFRSLHSAIGDARGLVEVSTGQYYAFDLPPSEGLGPIEVTLRQVTNQTVIDEFIQQEDAEHAVRSGLFTVRVSPASAGTLIDIIWKCDAAKQLKDALARAARNNGAVEDTVLGNALMTYVNSYTDVSGDVVPQAVLEQLNIALTDIMRSVSATRDLRVLLRDNYQRFRPNVVFDEITIPPSSNTPGVQVEVQALENQLRTTLGLFSTIFPALNFGPVWVRQPSHAPSAPPRSRAQLIADEFSKVFERRNVAVAVVTLADGQTIHYFSFSGGGRNIPGYIPENPSYRLARDMPPLDAQLPELPNLSASFSAQARDGDTERMLAHRVLSDFPKADTVKKLRIISLLEICQSCTICCIALAEHYKNATMEFSSFPPLPKVATAPSKNTAGKTIEL